MFKKYLVVASKLDKAGINITTQLSQFRQNPLFSSPENKPVFDFYLVEDEMIYTENLDFEKINKYDFVIFASKHSTSSEEKQKTLSVHTPGNFRDANMGGISGKVCPASALFNKFLFCKLNEKVKEHDLNDFNVTMEATHHGPLIEKPCVFIEIGSTEMEWKNLRAGFVVAKTIQETIEQFEFNPYREIAVGIGGPHYCPGFNKLQADSNVAFSHIIPGYVLPASEEMILEAIKKTIEENFDFVVLDWKGLGSAEARQILINALDKNYISWKKNSDVKR